MLNINCRDDAMHHILGPISSLVSLVRFDTGRPAGVFSWVLGRHLRCFSIFVTVSLARVHFMSLMLHSIHRASIEEAHV